MPGLVDDHLPVGLRELALLELHRIGTGGHRRVHQVLRNPEIAVVVEADLGNHITGLVGPDAPGSDAQVPLAGHVVAPSPDARSQSQVRRRASSNGIHVSSPSASRARRVHGT